MKKKIFAFLFTALLMLGAGAAIAAVGRTAKTLVRAEESQAPKTVLLLGLDGAACNSDVIILARYAPKKQGLTFFQIPRDTYLESDGEGGKINRFFAAAYEKTGDLSKAAEMTSASLSEAFGITIDGCVALRFSALSRIVDAVGGKVTIFVDGGIRSGVDVFKALALGADAVLIGRPVIPAIYAEGAEGLKIYLDKIHAELVDTMTMCGARKLSDIDSSFVFRP